MNREKFIRHLREHGCQFVREGASHSIWRSPATGKFEVIPRHREIKTPLARKICRRLEVPIPLNDEASSLALQPLLAARRLIHSPIGSHGPFVPPRGRDG